MTAVLEGLRALGAGRLVAMAAVAAGVLALLLVLTLRGGTARMGLLYGDLDLREAAQMADMLEHQHIAHQLGAGGSEILVPVEQIAAARLLLARGGLPTGGSIGYEIFDRGDGLLADSFTQRINQTRALEGELARSIQTIRGVRAARVHIVLPHREPFARNQQDAQASVLLTLAGAGRLDREEVQAILNLVAAAVPGLRPDKVALVDSRGTLLARAGEQSDGLAAAGTLAELQHATELRLSRAVDEMLERSLGAGHVQTEATVEMDLDQVHETQERFDPDGQVVRSTQTVSDANRSTEAAPTTSVQNNLPNAQAPQDTAGSQDNRQEETTNYEIGKTVRSVVRDHPQIRRISLAVLVDEVTEPDAKGVPQTRARTPEELARIAALVKSAVGYDEKRGDHIEVATMRFVREAASTPEHSLLGLHVDNMDMMRLAQTGLIGLLGLAALLFVLRPTMLRLVQMSAGAAADAPLALAGDTASGGGVLSTATGPRLLAGPEGVENAEAMVAMANIEGQIRASSVRRLVELVEKHPEESLSIVRTWMQGEAA